MEKSLKLIIISDLHCKHTSSDKDNKDKLLHSTILYSDLLRNDLPKHPVHALLEKIEEQKLTFKSNVLLCPGDITDKVDAQGFITGWSFLEEIQLATEATELYATLGNHDVNSRRNGDKILPFDMAKSIKYNYPIFDKTARKDYWDENFCIIDNPDYILLNFNSAHSHLNYDDASKSYITNDTLKQMDAKLKVLPTDKIKIAMCHHHPLSQSNSDYSDSDIIDKGELLLDLLNKYDFTILIHGHKHEIKIRYYNSLLVFGAGSFSSRLNLKETESENAFHLIELSEDKKGIINTWHYGSRSGWTQKPSSKIPPTTGFGYHGDLNNLALSVNDWFKTKSNGVNDLYENLVQAVPDVKYLIPEFQAKLKKRLSDNYSIAITYDENGKPVNISNLLG